MTLPKTRGTYWIALPLLAVGLAVLALTWGPSAGQQTEAATEAAKTQMELVISGTSPAQGPVTCTEGGPKCTLVLGSTFTLQVVPSIIPTGGYVGFQALVDYGNLTYKPDTIANENTWDFTLMPVREPAVPTGKEGQVVHGDVSSLLPPFPTSTQKTAIVALDMNCAGNSKTPGEPFSTVLSLIERNETTQPDGSAYIEAGGATFNVPNLSSINVNCVPKSQPTGSLSGIADVLVHGGSKVDQFFYCKTRLDHDATTDEVKTASVCYIDLPGQQDPDSDLYLVDPNIDLAGPPPPPPYGSAALAKGNGTYDSGTDTATVTTCFASLGGELGPNMIWVVTLTDVGAGLITDRSGTVDLYFGQGIKECDSKIPNGPPVATLPVNLTRYDAPPYDNLTSVDSDGDGCADAFELDKNRPKKDCGDDPWNPHDSDLNFNGIFTLTAEVIRADTCSDGQPAGPPPVGCDSPAQDKDIAAGSYISCQAVLDHDKNDSSITGRAFCYVDNPVTAVNIDDNGGHAQCAPFGTGTPNMCGDGLPGSAPPDPMADNDGASTPGIITGILDKVTNRLRLDVCFQGEENPTLGPNIYYRIDIDAHTLRGTMDIWLNRTDCTKPPTAPTEDDVAIAMAEQEADYDVDQDGCNTRQELGLDVFQGGQRDPFNKYDHMDMNKDGFIGIPDDLLALASLFGPVPPGTQGDVGPRMTGSVPWAHRSADGAIAIGADILGLAAQFGHNCAP